MMKALFFLSVIFVICVLGADSQACTNGSVRLVWGDGDWEGNVQICVNGVWGWVCDNSWGTNDAKVVCRQLNFDTNGNGAYYRTWSYYGWSNFTTPIHWDRLYCLGNETSLSTCNRDSRVPTCGHNEIAGVTCLSGGSCTGSSIRKVRNSIGTPNKAYGRFEICYNGQWSRICDGSWSSNDVKVACFELGYTKQKVFTYYNSVFGRGFGSYVYGSIGCNSNEALLSSCTLNSPGCSGSNDVGGACFGGNATSCTSGDIMLWRPSSPIGGPDHAGIALYCKNSIWISACDDFLSCHADRIFCQQLGYPGALARREEGYWGLFVATNDASGARTDRYTWSCTSSQTSLSQCSYTQRQWCGNGYDDQYGLICYPKLQGNECIEGEMKLVNGTSSNNGRVVYCFEGYWAPLCSLSVNTASAICQTLGYNSSYATIFNDERFGRSGNLSGFNYINCPSGASNVSSNCSTVRKSFSSGCYLSFKTCGGKEYGLQCYNNYGTCTDGSIRLVDGVIEQEGRIEVCSNGVWGTVCSNGWNPIDAYVICTQLGYTGADPISKYNAYYGYHSASGPPIFNNILCDAWDTSLSDCTMTTYPSSICSPQYTMGVVCKEGCTNGDIRLIGGTYENEGTVQICYNNLWGIISDEDWDNNDAMVVCRQLGYTTSGGNPLALLGSQYGRPNATIHLKNVSCAGTEARVDGCTKIKLSINSGSSVQSSYLHAAGVDCQYDAPTDPPCVMRPDSYNNHGGVCTNDSVRLVGGDVASSGRLEYCYNGYWSPFCKLDTYVAQVACRQLGYTDYSWGAIVESGEFGVLRNYSLFDNFTCTGNEASISGCTMNINTTCTPYCRSRNLGLRCYNPGVCTTEGAIRLADGIIDNEGRVEVCVNGVWGSVCDQGWDKTDAHVVCQQLGHPELEPYVFYNSTFGPGQYPVVYTNTDCGGWENELTSCTKDIYPLSSCSRWNVAGVLCGYDCNDGDVRLSGGNAPNEGTIEICFNNLWGLVAVSGWTSVEAGIVCEQLGYEPSGNTVTSFTKPDLTVHFTDFSCIGNEDRITSCSYTTLSLQEGKDIASTTNVAGVRCNTCPVMAPQSGTECTTEGMIRLTGGQSARQNEGTLEYCFKDKWSKFCYLGANEATVACRQLGYGGSEVAVVFTDGRFDNSSTVSAFTNFSCSVNTASELDECNIHDACASACNVPIGLSCYEGTNCVDGDVRLAGGDFDGEGRIEVCYKGVWGSICGSDFDETDAHVVCKQLGMDVYIAPTIYTNSHFGSGDIAVVLSNVDCKGYEASILSCPNSQLGSFTCSSNSVVGIACRANCMDGDVQLVGSNNTNEGTVLVCSENIWGVIGDNGWDNNDAQVICKQLNYSRGGEALLGSAYGKPNKIVLYNNVDCTGTETGLEECNSENLAADDGRDISSSVNFASVKCTLDPTASTSDVLSSNVSATASLIVLSIALVLLAISIVLTISCIVYFSLKRKQVGKAAKVIREPRVMVHGLGGIHNPMPYEEDEQDNEYNTAEKDEILQYIEKK